MRRVRLPGTELELSAFGLGLASMSRRLPARRRLEVLEAALDCGITHFDVAPLYGGGTAEALLGRFLRGRRDSVTVATKAGLAAAGPLGRRARRDFSPAGVERSVERSLRALRTEYVDLLLLHEPDAADLAPPLAEALARLVERGLVRETGIASSGRAAPAPPAGGVLQLGSSALEPVDAAGRALIVHSVLVSDLGRLAARWEGDPAALPSLILHRALAVHPGSALLFATRDPARVRANTREPSPELAERFERLVRE